MRNRIVWLAALLLAGFMGFSSSHAQENLLTNGGFEDAVLMSWYTYGNVTTEVVTQLAGATVPQGPIEGNFCLHLVVPTAGANFWDAGLKHPGHVFQAGKKYTLSAFLKCKQGTLQINFKPELDQDPYTGYGDQFFIMTNEWVEYSVTTPILAADVSPASITFHIAYTAGDFWMDGVRFYEGDYVPPDLGPNPKATNPTPGNGATGVATDTVLTWTPGGGATLHDIYFGTNPTPGPPEYKTTVTDPTYTPPGGLAYGTTYYWRIDEFDGATTYMGNIWSFTTTSPPSLVGWWKFDGDVLDSSGNGRNGSLQGDAHFEPGLFDQALALDGMGDYATIDGYKGILGGNPFSISAWVKSTSSGDVTMVNWGTQAGGQRVDFRLYQGRLRVEHGNGNLQGKTTVADGDWHHVAVTVTANAPISYPQVILYLDGKDDSQTTTDPHTFNIVANVDVTIGRRGTNNDRAFPGLIDDVRIYNWALMASEIAVLTSEGMKTATNPSPPDGAGDVPTDTVITWTSGSGATSHHIYFGANQADVASGAPDTDKGTQIQAETSYTPGSLAYGTTYYWRIDEFDGTTIYRGNIWSFTTQGQGEGNILFEYFWGTDATLLSLLNLATFPDSPDQSEWPTSLEGPINWRDTYGTRVRGYLYPPAIGNYTFWIASDDQSQLWLSTDEDPAHAVHIASVLSWTPSRGFDRTPEQRSSEITLEAGRRYYIEALHSEGWGGDNLAVAWQGPSITTRAVISGTFLSPWMRDIDLKASNPSPSDGATLVATDVLLSWTPGIYAEKHDVYLGTVFDDVVKASRVNPLGVLVSQNQIANTYDPILEYGQTYYWRIDEVSAPPDTMMFMGNIWSFTTTFPPSLIGWWKLDEGSGTLVLDSSGHDNHGTINNPDGGLGAGGSVWYTDPEHGTVASFNGDDGSGAYISAGWIPAMTLTNDFTWTFWAKQDIGQDTTEPPNCNDVVLGNRFGGTQSPVQFIKFTPTSFEFWRGGQYGIDYDDIPGGVWIHHAVVKDGQSLTYYRDGVPSGTRTIGVTVDPNPFFIGGDPEGERWRGLISNVRIYNYALTDSAIADLVNEGSNTDSDGVTNAVEAGAPNGGDGNSDGIPDSQQNNVTSLPNGVNQEYVTIVSEVGTLENVSATADPPADPPTGVGFPIGFFAFTVSGITSGGSTTVTLLLPAGHTVQTYYKYGRTSDNPTKHWYEFLWDGTTGAEILPDRIILHFVDGQRGDGDLTEPAQITDPGAPAAIQVVSIDVKPGSYPNSFNNDAHGVIPVAILGSASFDVSQIDVSTLRLDGLALRMKGNGAYQFSIKDVSGNFSNTMNGEPDGYPDLVCQFLDEDGVWNQGESIATVRGKLSDGAPFVGTDSIKITQ